MATFKFQVTKIAANPALQGSLTPNHVYFSQFTEANSNWNSEMFVAYVTDDNAVSPSAIRQGIISLRRHQGGGIYYEDIRANWPPANNANAVGLITGIFGDNGSPYAGAAGFGRAVVLGSSFIKTFDPALGTFVLNTDQGTAGITQFDFQLTDSNGAVATTAVGAGMFDVNNASPGSWGNSTSVNAGTPVVKFRYQNFANKTAILAPDTGLSGQPEFRKILGGTVNAVSTVATRGDIWMGAYNIEYPPQVFGLLIKKGVGEDWGKSAIFDLEHFQVYTGPFAEDVVALGNLPIHQTFLPPRSATGPERPVRRAIEAGTSLIVPVTATNNDIGDINFQSATATVGRLVVRWGGTAGFGKQAVLDPTYFVKGTSGGIDDMLTLNPTALGQLYSAGNGINLNANQFGFSDGNAGTTNNLSGANYGIDYQANHLRLAYENTQFLINSNGRLEIKPGVLGGSDWKESVRISSTANIGGTYAADFGGTNGRFTNVNLTTGANWDGLVNDAAAPITLVVGNRVLVRNQTVPSQNGIYEVVVAGAAGELRRASDSNLDSLVSSGNTVNVENGASQLNAIMRLVTDDPINVESSQTTQQWERIAVFAINDGVGVFIDQTLNPNNITFRDVNTSLPVTAGHSIRGILYQNDYIAAAIDTDLLQFRVTTTNTEAISFRDMPPRTVLSHSSVAPSKPTFVTGANNDVLLIRSGVTTWGQIDNNNVGANAAIALSKLQTIPAYSIVSNNTAATALFDDIVSFAANSMIYRGNASGGILNTVIGGDLAGEQGGFLARPKVGAAAAGNLGPAVFDTDTFGWVGNKLFVGWANVQW